MCFRCKIHGPIVIKLVCLKSEQPEWFSSRVRIWSKVNLNFVMADFGPGSDNDSETIAGAGCQYKY